MLDLQSEVQPKTIRRIEKMTDSYPTAELFFQGVIDRQITELKNSNFYMQLDTQKYEEQYSMTTETFYAKFVNGEVDDREDFMIWSGLHELVLENEEEIRGLT